MLPFDAFYALYVLNIPCFASLLYPKAQSRLRLFKGLDRAASAEEVHVSVRCVVLACGFQLEARINGVRTYNHPTS